MSAAQARTACAWHVAGGGAEVAARIIAFLDAIGIGVEVAPITGRAFVPGMIIEKGLLLVDPDCPAWPGDLLHEAGHVAVTHPELRPSLCDVGADPGEEMAAIAWSWAAARACGVAAGDLFHQAGYRGGAASLAENFEAGRYIGVPMLAWYGMTADPSSRAPSHLPAYPAMARWLR